MSEKRTMSLRESAEFDRKNGASARVTGWGAVSKKLAGPNSKSQRRKKAKKS